MQSELGAPECVATSPSVRPSKHLSTYSEANMREFTQMCMFLCVCCVPPSIPSVHCSDGRACAREHLDKQTSRARSRTRAWCERRLAYANKLEFFDTRMHTHTFTHASTRAKTNTNNYYVSHRQRPGNLKAISRTLALPISLSVCVSLFLSL